jgi:hypothetical protein
MSNSLFSGIIQSKLKIKLLLRIFLNQGKPREMKSGNIRLKLSEKSS